MARLSKRLRLAASLSALAAVVSSGAVQAGPIEPFAVSAEAKPDLEVRAGAKGLELPVRATCSAECNATAAGLVSVKRRGQPAFTLPLTAERAEVPADTPTVFRPRLSRAGTKRLNSTLDSAGTVATARLRIDATDSSGADANARDTTSLEPGFDVLTDQVSPDLAFFDGKRKAAVGFRFRAAGRSDLRVELRRDGGPAVRTWKLDSVRPFARQRVSWNGLTRNGDDAPDGRYSFHVGLAGERLRRAGRFEFRGHAFPVAGPHGTRGQIGEFGAGRSGGRTHEGFDITADCGTRLVAARGGRVVRRGFDPVLYGWFAEIRARRSGRRLFYSHLRVVPPVRDGERVRTGQTVGEVGQTGNAESTPCHLHFEIRANGRPLDPEPELRRWDGWS